VEFLFGHNAHADAAGNATLRFAPLPHAAAVLFDELANRDAQRQLDAARVIHVAADAVQLRSVTAGVARVFRIGRDADGFQPIGSAIDHVRHAGERLDIVDDGRLAERAFDGGKRRLNPRPAALAFEALNQSRLFAADICPGAAVQVHVEAEFLTEDVFAEQ